MPARKDVAAQASARQVRAAMIEVMGQGEREHYRVRWQDGHESVYFPGPDARVVSAD